MLILCIEVQVHCPRQTAYNKKQKVFMLSISLGCYENMGNIVRNELLSILYDFQWTYIALYMHI